MNRDTYKLALTSAPQRSRSPSWIRMISWSFRITSGILPIFRETLSSLLSKAHEVTGDIMIAPMITGSGGLTLAKHLGVSFVQEVIAVSTALTHYAPQTDVAIELGGEDAKIIYFENGNVEQRMNGICAGEPAPLSIRWLP